jgi:glycosyltransferase involved in cell wall biosynthesis
MPHGPKRAPISAMIISRNEAHLLDDCLASVAFCDQIVVIDLDCDDDTAIVAKRYGAELWHHEFVPIADIVQAELIGKLRHDWVIFLDPDEVLSKPLQREIAELIPALAPDIAQVLVPIRFYFKSHALRGTPWGGKLWKDTICHKARITLTHDVHSARHPKPGFRSHRIARSQGRTIHHYWMRTWRGFFDKHNRYIPAEGPSRYNRGLRTTFTGLLGHLPRQFHFALIKRKGYRDGALGVFLSLFWAVYELRAQISLYAHQRRRNNS